MAQETGRLAENIVHFARALRAAGIPVGPGSVLDALAAVEAAGVSTRDAHHGSSPRPETSTRPPSPGSVHGPIAVRLSFER